MSETKPRPIQRDWLSKTLAGLVLGFTAALACSGICAHLIASMPLTLRAQLSMWMLAPIWLGVLSCVYFFASGWRAWLWLGAGNLLLFGAWAVLRLL